MLIPVPVLGAVVGNTVGTMMYQIAKNNLSSREQKIFEERECESNINGIEKTGIAR